MPYFAVDINGLAGPNKWGHDVFPFYMAYTNKKFTLEGYTGCSPVDVNSGGIQTQTLINKLYGQR